MKLHGGPNLARGPEFDTHDLKAQCINGCNFIMFETLARGRGEQALFLSFILGKQVTKHVVIEMQYCALQIAT